MVGPASSNPSTWYLEMANNTDFYIRLATDSDQALCISYGKKEENQPCHLWYNFNHREWAQKWVININQTLSPVGGKHLVLGTKADGSSLILVPLDSLNCVYLERSEDAMKLVKAELTLKAAYNLEKFGQYITQNNLKDLAEKGHVKLNGLVPIEMVKKALREINKQLG